MLLFLFFMSHTQPTVLLFAFKLNVNVALSAQVGAAVGVAEGSIL